MGSGTDNRHSSQTRRPDDGADEEGVDGAFAALGVAGDAAAAAAAFGVPGGLGGARCGIAAAALGDGGGREGAVGLLRADGVLGAPCFGDGPANRTKLGSISEERRSDEGLIRGRRKPVDVGVDAFNTLNEREEPRSRAIGELAARDAAALDEETGVDGEERGVEGASAAAIGGDSVCARHCSFPSLSMRIAPASRLRSDLEQTVQVKQRWWKRSDGDEEEEEAERVSGRVQGASMTTRLQQ